MEAIKLKILFISSWYPNKFRPLNGIFVKRHAVANSIDCDVSAAFVCSAESESVEELMEDGIYTIRGYYKRPAIKLLKPIRYLQMWKRIFSVYEKKKGKPDLVNANIVYPVSIIAAWLKKMHAIPYVVTEHCTYYFPEDGRYKGFITKFISRIGISNSSAVITVSHKLSNAMQLLGLKNKYFIIPNVVDTDIFTCKSTNPSPQGLFNFLHISSLDEEQKNITGIIRVFKRFRTRYPHSKLTIVWNEENKESMDRIKMKEPFSEVDGVFCKARKWVRNWQLFFIMQMHFYFLAIMKTFRSLCLNHFVAVFPLLLPG